MSVTRRPPLHDAGLDAPDELEATCFGPLLIDHAAREIRVDDRVIALTLCEYELLRFLVMNPRRVHTRRALVTMLWGERRDIDMRSIDGHVGRLRAKLGPGLRDCIRTVRGVGYAFTAPSVAPSA